MYPQPFFRKEKTLGKVLLILLVNALILLLWPQIAYASEADLVLPGLAPDHRTLLMGGIVVCILGMLFGFYQFKRVSGLQAHTSMLEVAEVIYETCKTYLIQQGKFLITLFIFIGACIAFYFGFLEGKPFETFSSFCMYRYRYPRFLHRGLVRHSYEHPCQQPYGLRVFEERPYSCPERSP